MGLLIRLIRALLPAVVLVAGTAPPSLSAGDDPVGGWPLRPEPEVVARFDPPTSPYGPGHRGVDLLGRVGQSVRAALAGTVTYAGPLGGRGVVVVSHGDTRTTYEPVSATVSVGDTVGAGAAIGSLQGVGSHCAPRVCLHWGWLRGETYLDPLRLVGAGPVRLLPLWRDDPVARAPTPARTPASTTLPYDDWRPLAAWVSPVRPGGGPAGRPGGAGRW